MANTALATSLVIVKFIYTHLARFGFRVRVALGELPRKIFLFLRCTPRGMSVNYDNYKCRQTYPLIRCINSSAYRIVVNVIFKLFPKAIQEAVA
jgi:hypothetical protein